VELVIQRGSIVTAFTVNVCAIDKPRFDAFALARLDSDSWRILPIRYVWAGYGIKLVHDERAIHESLSKGDHIVLANAPEDVAIELQELSL
jgi:hypothetical protein